MFRVKPAGPQGDRLRLPPGSGVSPGGSAAALRPGGPVARCAGGRMVAPAEAAKRHRPTIHLFVAARLNRLTRDRQATAQHRQ